MFILRRKTADGREVNICLNDSYHLILEETNLEEFKKTRDIYGETFNDEVIYGYVTYNEGNDIIPLYRPSKYYIMTSDGKTFSNITLK